MRRKKCIEVCSDINEHVLTLVKYLFWGEGRGGRGETGSFVLSLDGTFTEAWSIERYALCMDTDLCKMQQVNLTQLDIL